VREIPLFIKEGKWARRTNLSMNVWRNRFSKTSFDHSLEVCHGRITGGKLLLYAINTRGGADEEVFSGDGGSGHPHVVFGELRDSSC